MVQGAAPEQGVSRVPFYCCASPMCAGVVQTIFGS